MKGMKIKMSNNMMFCPEDQSVLVYHGKQKLMDFNETKPIPIFDYYIWKCSLCNFSRKVKVE